jgi:Lrp/AsnC family transcriptional regulator, regulator for asnA, asnC and gidA
VGFQLDEIDSKIVHALHADGRMTNTEVGRRLGCAEATVRKRVARLVEDGVIQFQAWVDPLKVGYDVYAIIQIQVSPPQIEAVAETLAKLPEIAFLGVCTGDFDIFAAAVLRSNADLYDFLTKRLGEVPGIIRTATSSMIRLVKREYAFPIPALPAGATAASSSATDAATAPLDGNGRRPARRSGRAPAGAATKPLRLQATPPRRRRTPQAQPRARRPASRSDRARLSTGDA